MLWAEIWDLKTRLPTATTPPVLPGALTSVVLHPGVVGDALRPKAEAQDVAGIRAVSDQEGPIRLPFQLHLRILPVHGPPVPPALRKRDTERQQNTSKEDCITNQKLHYLLSLVHF